MNISKKGQIALFPPPELNDYLILIAPTAEIHGELKKINDKLHKALGTKEKPRFKTHIPLFNSAWEKDNHVLDRLKKAIADTVSFPIAINGVDILSHGLKKKTLYLKVENPKPLLELYEACRKGLKLKKGFIPHLAIEKNIPVADFEKIKDNLESFNHQCGWTCDRITVLKFNKKTETYKLVEEILLQSGAGS